MRFRPSLSRAVTPMPDVRTKALSYLRDGCVRVLKSDLRPGPRQPYIVMAHVDGHKSTYMVQLQDRRWTCTCHQSGCAHAAAVQLVTGYPSAAAKPQEMQRSAG